MCKIAVEVFTLHEGSPNKFDSQVWGFDWVTVLVISRDDDCESKTSLSVEDPIHRVGYTDIVNWMLGSLPSPYFSLYNDILLTHTCTFLPSSSCQEGAQYIPSQFCTVLCRLTEQSRWPESPAGELVCCRQSIRKKIRHTGIRKQQQMLLFFLLNVTEYGQLHTLFHVIGKRRGICLFFTKVILQYHEYANVTLIMSLLGSGPQNVTFKNAKSTFTLILSHLTLPMLNVAISNTVLQCYFIDSMLLE